MRLYQNLFQAFLSIAIVGSLAANAMATADFEDLLLGTVYNNGVMFSSNDVDFTVGDFTFGGGATTTTGTTTVVNPNSAGTGNGMTMGNVNLEVAIAAGLQSVGFAYAEFGGNVNLTVNGTLFNTDDFVDSDGVVDPDFSIFVTETMPGSNVGFVTVTGSISQFSFGGQELDVDDVRAVVPEPSGGILLVIGGFILMTLRKRK